MVVSNCFVSFLYTTDFKSGFHVLSGIFNSRRRNKATYEGESGVFSTKQKQRDKSIKRNVTSQSKASRQLSGGDENISNTHIERNKEHDTVESRQTKLSRIFITCKNYK